LGSISYSLNGGPLVQVTDGARLVFYGLDGDDTMNIDLSDGSPLVSDYIAFAGGAGKDTLHIEANQQYGIGAAINSFLAGGQRVFYAEVEAISLSGAAGLQGFAGQERGRPGPRVRRAERGRALRAGAVPRRPRPRGVGARA